MSRPRPDRDGPPARRPTPDRPRARPAKLVDVAAPDDAVIGRQSVREALRAGRAIRRIVIADTAHIHGVLGEIVAIASDAGVRVDRLPRAALDLRARGGMHQGVIAEVDAVQKARSWRDAIAAARAREQAPLLVALDGIQDPQNLGAITRSAEVFGAHGVLVPDRRSAPLSSAAARAAAGAFEHLPVARVVNLERTLAECKESGLWIVALDAKAPMTIDACELLSEPLVIVIGAEGEGVSRLIRAKADMSVSIPTTGRIESLNASAAAAVCLWEVARHRRS